MSNCTTFIDVNARFGDKPALIHPTSGRSVSYSELPAQVNRRASLLSQKGIVEGDRVCIYLVSSPEYVLWYFAIWRAGAVAVPLNNVLTEDEVSYMVQNSGARAVVTDMAGREVATGVGSSLSGKLVVLVEGTQEFADALFQASPVYESSNRSPEDLCQLQYTSGTTGKQKGAMLTHANWMAAMDAERELLRLSPDDRYLGIYPMAHVGVSWGISALRAGATWVIMERFSLDRYIDLIREYRPTVITAMPPVIHSLTQTPEGTEEAFRGARLIISGGGPLHPSIWKDFYRRFSVPIVNAYGLSETIVVGTGTAIRPEDYGAADEFRSVGHPVGYTEVRIVDISDHSQRLRPMEMGEIALRGPAIAKGYWNMPEESAAVFLDDGWFLTGDVGFIDSDGMVSITDRKKDMIVMSGWKIYPTEVEKVLIQHPKIRDVAVFGCPDLHRGEMPVAAVVPVGDEITLEEIRAFCEGRLARYKVPRRVVSSDKLPRVGGWKLLRRELRNHFCAEEGW